MPLPRKVPSKLSHRKFKEHHRLRLQRHGRQLHIIMPQRNEAREAERNQRIQEADEAIQGLQAILANFN